MSISITFINDKNSFLQRRNIWEEWNGIKELRKKGKKEKRMNEIIV